MNIDGFEVTPIHRDPTYVDELEEKIRTVPNFLSKSETLWSTISQAGSSFFEIKDCGLVGIVNTRAGYYADAHITFWDGKLEGKEEVCRELATLLIEACRLHFLLTYIPERRLNLIGFASDVGFVPIKRSNGVVMMSFFKERIKWE